MPNFLAIKSGVFGYAGALLLVVVLSSSTSFARCVFPNLKYFPDQQQIRKIEAKVNDTCLFVTTPGSNSALVDNEILLAPKLGRFGKANAYTLAYKAPGIPGVDLFVYKKIWKDRRTVRWTIFRNEVTITQ